MSGRTTCCGDIRSPKRQPCRVRSKVRRGSRPNFAITKVRCGRASGSFIGSTIPTRGSISCDRSGPSTAARKARMSVWEAIEYLNRLMDDSDPDTDLPQIEHSLQTAVSDPRRRASAMVSTVRIDPRFRKSAVPVRRTAMGRRRRYVSRRLPVFRKDRLSRVLRGQSRQPACPSIRRDSGIYEEGCGLDNVLMSWGHDEYLYHVVKEYLPDEALYIIRYHSFYPGHREGEYDYLMNDRRSRTVSLGPKFSPFDLYSKSPSVPTLPSCRRIAKG